MAESEAAFSADQDELMAANGELEEQVAAAKAAAAAAEAKAAAAEARAKAAESGSAPSDVAASASAASGDSAQLLSRVSQLEEELQLASTAHSTKVRELLACQETLAQTKADLLNLRLAHEEQQQAMQAPPAASPSGSSSSKPAAALKGLFKKK